MGLTWPVSLLGLIAVAGVAAWALLRPARQHAVVGSLSLWREALAALDRPARRTARRITAGWLLLLAGAAAGVVALARPVWRSRLAARRVSVVVHGGAELGGRGRGELEKALDALVDRFDARQDRLQAVAPTLLGGAAEYASVGRGRTLLRDSTSRWVPAGEMTIPPPDPRSAHVYRFIPAGLNVQTGPDSTAIELPTDLPPVTIDAIGGAMVDANRAELFVALRHDGPTRWSGRLHVRGLRGSAGPGGWQELDSVGVEVEPRSVLRVARRLPASAAMAVSLTDGGSGQLGAAYLARTDARRRKAATIGADEPLLRRFIEADATLEHVAAVDEADLVIANRPTAAQRPPADMPALLIDPAIDPPGWRRGGEVRSAVLSAADVAADDPVMRHVDLASVAVRRMRPWVPAGRAAQKVLVSLGGDGLILRNLPGGAGPQARRVHVAFELGGDNTNLAMSEAFVVFLANAVRWLAPGGAGEATYLYQTPRQALDAAGWRRLAGAAAPTGPVPAPGVFRDETGAVRAVSLVGLRRGRPKRPALEAVAAAPLPAPAPLGRTTELWPVAAVAAIGLWLGGWVLRIRA